MAMNLMSRAAAKGYMWVLDLLYRLWIEKAIAARAIFIGAKGIVYGNLVFKFWAYEH